MARSRNTILVDIVNAVGGTARNAFNRNMLLEDWLCAIGGSCPIIPAVSVWNINGTINCNGVIPCDDVIPCGV